MLSLSCPGLGEPLSAAYKEFGTIARADCALLGVAETPLGALKPDPKRYLEFGELASDIPAALRALRKALIDTLDRSVQLLEMSFHRNLAQPLNQMIDREIGPILRFTWYPEGYVGEVNQPHTDIDLFTLLPAANQPGLEWRVNDVWRPASIGPEEIAVMPGDILHELGAAHAIEHRVIGGGPERISASLFVNAVANLTIKENVQAGDLMKARLDAVRMVGGNHA